jgi:hypothetical protein
VAEKNAPSYKLEQYSGYALWTFQGRNLKRFEGTRLWNVAFRPHVTGILGPKDKKAVLKQLRDKAPIYDEQDKAVKNAKKEVFLGGFRSKQRAFNDELAAIDTHFMDALNHEELQKWKVIYNASRAA